MVALASLSCAGGAKTSQQNGAGIQDEREDVVKSYDLLKDENINTHGTRLFRQRSALHVRHGLDLHLALQPRERCGDNPYTFVLTEDAEERPAVTAFTWTQQPSFEDQGKLHFRFHVNRSIPVGMYALHAADPCDKQDNGEKKIKGLGDVFVMFNPREAEGNERKSLQALRKTNILTTTKATCGSEMVQFRGIMQSAVKLLPMPQKP